MRRDQVIYLIPTVPGKNKMGDAIRIPGKPRRILAEKKSIRQSEFYQAAVTDYKPELTFVIWPHEFDGESILEYKGKHYNIFRTFEKDMKNLELICEGTVVDGESTSENENQEG